MTYLERVRQMKPYIQKGVRNLTDAEALQIKTLYPAWEPNVTYEADYRLLYDGDLYRVRQSHTSLEIYPPGSPGTESLYTRIDEDHGGTLEDPIPYDGNMALALGKYYSQDGVVYYCFRDTGSPVYHGLSDLVGLYVEVAT